MLSPHPELLQPLWQGRNRPPPPPATHPDQARRLTMSRVSRALLIVSCVFVVWIVVVILVGMREAPPWRLLGISFYLFLFFAYLLFRYLARERTDTKGAVAVQPDQERVRRFLRFSAILGKFYIVSGAIAIWHGLTTDRNPKMFLAIGVLVWCFAAYLLLLARSRRRADLTKK